MDTLWGIDLGGTKVEGVVLPRYGGVPLARMRIPTESERGYRHIVSRVAELVERLEQATGTRRPAAIGVGTPGSVIPDSGLMKNCNTTCLNGEALPRDLADALSTSVRVANDANCFALAEATLGAGRGYPTVFGVIMGTGVGGGVVVDGRVLDGRHGVAGEWGHTIADPEGLPCYCGRRGCVETILSGPALERFYQGVTGNRKRLPDILSEDSNASRDTESRLLEWFGRTLAQVVNVLDPDAIILGGGVGQIPSLRVEGREALRHWVFSDRFDTPLLLPELGDSAGVFGAAMLVA